MSTALRHPHRVELYGTAVELVGHLMNENASTTATRITATTKSGEQRDFRLPGGGRIVVCAIGVPEADYDQIRDYIRLSFDAKAGGDYVLLPVADITFEPVTDDGVEYTKVTLHVDVNRINETMPLPDSSTV